MGAVKETGSLAKELGKKALIITDNLLEKLGVLDEVKNSLEIAAVPFGVFNKVVTEPTLEYVGEALKVYKDESADLLIGVGGGSSMDTAKAVSALVGNPGKKLGEFAGKNMVPRPGAAVIEIPTTAGTGSEVSKFCVISDTAKDVKILMGSPHLIAQIAIVDPLMTVQMPRRVTAATGMDALTHAIEAYINTVPNKAIVDFHAIQAIRLISGNLRQAWCNGSNLEARSNVMLGALEAGLALGNVASALVHAMARVLGGYFHISHGILIAAILPVVVEFSISGDPKRYADVAEAMGEKTEGLPLMEAASLAVKAVRKLSEDIQIPTLRGLGIEEKKFISVLEEMAKAVESDAIGKLNPRLVTKEEAIELYRKAF
jgi:alcohol dehydrogenase class IV